MTRSFKSLPIEQLSPHFQVVRPPGAGPGPVMVQLHGCGGVQPFHASYAEVARSHGVGVVIVDSLAPRGLSRRAAHATVCTGLRLRAAERARDLAVVVRWLCDQDWVDADRIGAAGWSHGGWTIMEGLCEQSLDLRPLDRIRSVALFYPYAGPPSRTHLDGWGERRPQVFACLAGRDQVVGRRAPRRALDRLRSDGLTVNILDLAGATHAFDDDHATDPRTRFRQDLACEARSFYLEALKAL